MDGRSKIDGSRTTLLETGNRIVYNSIIIDPTPTEKLFTRVIRTYLVVTIVSITFFM